MRFLTWLLALSLLSLPPATHAGGHGSPIFVADERMMKIYHVGLPCSEPSEDKYHYLIDLAAPQMLTESTPHVVVKYAHTSAMSWAFPNACNRTRQSRVNMSFRYEGEPFATAVVDTSGMMVDNVSLSRTNNPEPDAFDASLAEILYPGGKWYEYELFDPDDTNPEPFLNDLRALLPEATAEQRVQLLYRMGRYLYTHDVVRLRNIRSEGGDRDAYIRSISNADGEHRGLALLREAAEFGHLGAALEVYEKSGLNGHLHPYKSSAALRAPDDEAIRDLLRRYGFVFSLAQRQQIGPLLSEISILAQKGYSIADDGVFADPNLPPSGRAIENELNADLARVMNQAGRAITQVWELPGEALYDCDGTWCKILGGLGGRVRLNVKGQPDCDKPSNGRTICRFRAFLNVDSGDIAQQMPYQADPVITILDGLYEQVDGRELVNLEAEMIRRNDAWKLAALLD